LAEHNEQWKKAITPIAPSILLEGFYGIRKVWALAASLMNGSFG
jgi:hypothetical protein